MKFKKLLALFLAVLMLASTFVLTASAEGTDEKKGLAWDLNYFSYIPVYQENQDINADKPTLLMSGRGINNLALLRDADQYGDLTQFDEFFSEDDKKFNDDNNKFLKIDFTQTFAFSPDHKILYATLKMVDRDKIVIDEENDPYWEGVDLYLDFGRKAIGDKMTIWDSGSPEEIDIASDVEAVRPEAAGDGSKVYHVALSRGGFLRASEMGGVQHMDAVQTRVVNPTGDEKNYRGDVYYSTQYVMAIDLEKLGILDEIAPGPDASANGSDGPFIGFYAEYTSIHGDIERVDFEDYRDDPDVFDEEFVYHIYTKQKLEDRESWPNTPNRFNVLSVGKHSPWDATLLYEDEARTIPRGVLVGGCYLEGDQYESVTIPAYMTPDLKECTADTEGALPVLEVGFTSVGSGVFENNPYVKHVTVPATIERINDQAFRSNYIETITFEGADTGFEEKGGFNLYLSSALKDVTLPANMTVFPKGFLRKTGLTSVKLPSGLVEVREDGMRESDLVKVTFPDGFETLGTKGLYHCEDLKEIFFPASTKTIGDAAIQSCYSLEKVVILSMDCEINKTAFLGSNTRNLVIVGYPNSTVHEFAKANNYKFECYEHDYVEIVVPATVDTGDGYILKKCSACGHETTESNAVNDPWPNPFADVVYRTDGGKSSWFANQVKFVYTNKLFIGTNDTSFEPNTPMTRAMFCKVLANLEKVEVDNTVTVTALSDVESNKWYTGAVAWTIDNKIVEGYKEDGTFRPNNQITRAEMSMLFYKYLYEYKDMKYLAYRHKDGVVDSFTDAPFAHWSTGAIEMMKNNGYISGFKAEDGTYSFQPNGKATRAQVAQIFFVVCTDLGLLD
jgi:hypothetical protein